jgi:hypothetical protein
MKYCKRELFVSFKPDKVTQFNSLSDTSGKSGLADKKIPV